MPGRRGPRGDNEEPARVAEARKPFLRDPPAWPGDFEGFEKRWGPEGGPDVTEQVAAALEAELARELSPDHPLQGRHVVAIAKREGTDDVLFALPGSDAVAVVHLTWAGQAEQPPWPSTEMYASFDDFIAAAPEDYGF